jgi:hypothetical protein
MRAKTALRTIDNISKIAILRRIFPDIDSPYSQSPFLCYTKAVENRSQNKPVMRSEGTTNMKLLFAIVQNDDQKSLTYALIEKNISVTRIASTAASCAAATRRS